MGNGKLDRILEHYRNPRNYGELEGADAHAKESNMVCGDLTEIFVKVREGRIEAISFKGKGCMLSQASASILTEYARGMSVEEAMRLSKQDVFRMLGIELGPVRSRCAMLSVKAMRKALKAYLENTVLEHSLE